jgi:chemotaxis protein MotB
MSVEEAPARVARLRRRQHLVSHDRWLVSYADLMTLLFAFFVVLFAASHHSSEALGKLSGAIHSGFAGGHAAAGGASAPTLPRKSHAAASIPAPPLHLTPSDFTALATELRSVLQPSIDRHEVSVEQTADGLVISFREIGFFHSGEANLLAGQAAQIVTTGAILQQHDLVLRVEGHSDDQPIHNAVFASNWELSAARAMTVLLLLVDQSHYDPTRISMAGYGPYRPVADNATPDGRRKNRRVDLVIVSAQPRPAKNAVAPASP